MRNETQRITLSYILLVVLLCVMLASYVPTVGIAYAQDKVYSNVLDDLKKDTTFNESMYPEIADNYTLSVITVAESEDKELFVYVYQPSGQKKNLRASSINISLKADEDLNPLNYELEYLNSNGVFFKYKVVGLTVPLGDSRRYLIPSIFRPFDESLNDKQATGGNTVDEVVFAVGKEFRFSLINGQTSLSVLDIYTIEVTDKFVGFVRYPNGGGIIQFDAICDSHFVAFSTDKPIDYLCEASISYIPHEVWYRLDNGERIYSHVGETETIVINENDPTVTYHPRGLFAGTYEWKRIQSIDEFKASTNSYTNVYYGAVIDASIATPLTEEAEKQLEGKQWVLRFKETDYIERTWQDMIGSTVVARYNIKQYTFMNSVTILRLKFITDGVLYNLGVVDNNQTGSQDPTNRWDDPDIHIGFHAPNLPYWLKVILFAILVVIILILLAPILPYIFKAIFWIISLPFKAIGAIVKACKKDKDKDKVEDVLLGDKVVEDVKSKRKSKRTKRVRKNE